MSKLFQVIPPGFFNYLSSMSRNEIYSDCLELIYEQYEREISYRIERSRIRDALAAYLLENRIDSLDDEDAVDVRADYNDEANSIIRKFCSKDVGWLEEDNDDATYEKHIIMTENGILLAEFLQQLQKAEREEFSSYIFNIYNVLRNDEQWEMDPYVNGLKNVYRNARLLSKALKRLSTFIRKIIERMVAEETLESLTENIIEYCEGSFIREYARLTKQQNIHNYRAFIRTKLENIRGNEEMMELLVIGCAVEENVSEAEAAEQVQEMIHRTIRFLNEDYNTILRDIKHKINIYLQMAVGRARFLRNRESDVRGSVEQTLRYLAQTMRAADFKEDLPEEMSAMFLLERHEFIDTGSLRYPRKAQAIHRQTVADLEEMTEEDLNAAKLVQEREAYNPYSQDKMKEYLEHMMGDDTVIDSSRLPMESERDLLCALSAAAYGGENGFEIRKQDGYMETNHMILRRFEVRKKKREDESA